MVGCGSEQVPSAVIAVRAISACMPVPHPHTGLRLGPGTRQTTAAIPLLIPVWRGPGYPLRVGMLQAAMPVHDV